MQGQVVLYLGSMRSRKSSKLLEKLDEAEYRHKKALFIRPLIDTREFVSRNQKYIEYQFVKKLSDLTNIDDIAIFCIDEGQFFEDLGVWSNEQASRGAEVFISALNGDTDMNAWDAISNCIPFADKIYRLNAVCESCHDNSKATFSFYNGKKNKIEIGDGDKYKVYCRECYNKYKEALNE